MTPELNCLRRPSAKATALLYNVDEHIGGSGGAKAYFEGSRAREP